MRRPVALLPGMLCALLSALAASSAAEPFRFSVLMHAATGSDGEATLRSSLEEAQLRNPSFIVVNGIKESSEACSDRLFRRRKAVLEAADAPVFLSMAGSDWINCRDRRGRPAETVWLGLLREQLYGDISWNGSKQLNLRRQSALPAFRSYAENTRWSVQQVMFATLHLPAQNNHYVTAAGRNSEFEDRLIANRDWLRRLAQLASIEHRKAVVLFCDGRLWPVVRPAAGIRDGYQEMRSALRAFAAAARMPVLLVQGPAGNTEAAPAIEWQGKLGRLSLPQGVTDLEVDPEAALPFALAGPDNGAAPAQ